MSLTRFLGKNPSDIKQLSNEELLNPFETKIEDRNSEELSGETFNIKVPFSIGILCGIIIYNFTNRKE